MADEKKEQQKNLEREASNARKEKGLEKNMEQIVETNLPKEDGHSDPKTNPLS